MEWKRILCLALALLTLCFEGCGKQPDPEPEEETPEPIALQLWIYPEGEWSDVSAVNRLVQGFVGTATDLSVEVRVLEADGQAAVSAAIESRQAPDLLLGTVAQLQHARRSGAVMADVTACARGAYTAVKESIAAQGTVFAAPLAMDVTAMAINYELFQNVGALQYIDEEHHTWTTEGFIAAMKALAASKQVPQAAALYCGGQNGDQGTRALVTNLYGGSVTNAVHDRYVLDEQPTLDALTLLKDMRGMAFDDKIVGSDENVLFCQQQLAMTFCWDSHQSEPEDFTAFPMAYPTDRENALLPGEVWGVSVLDSGDERRTEAALTLVEYLCSGDVYPRAAAMTGHYPVRPADGDAEDVWTSFTAHMAPYEASTPGWAVARSEWWQLLQRIGQGGDVALETDTFCTNANAAAAFATRKP